MAKVLDWGLELSGFKLQSRLYVYFCSNTLGNKSLKQYSKKPQLYGNLLPITENIQVRQTRHMRYNWRSRYELIRNVFPMDYFLWTCQSWLTNKNLPKNSSVRTQDVVRKTNRERWMIGTKRERERERESKLHDLMRMTFGRGMNPFNLPAMG